MFGLRMQAVALDPPLVRDEDGVIRVGRGRGPHSQADDMLRFLCDALDASYCEIRPADFKGD